MNPDNSKTLPDQFLYQGLGFFGAITASVTHEFNNILGTIDQLSGLLEDLTVSSGQEKAISEDQINAITGRISLQTERGLTLVKQLNTFAHTSDHKATEFNVYNALENLQALMKRLVSTQKKDLILTGPGEEILVNTNAFFLLQALFLIISRILPLVVSDSAIEMTLCEQNDNAVITIKARLNGALIELPDDRYLGQLISGLQGNSKERFDNELYSLELRVPRSDASV
ncbi:MAG: hypothetical protein GY841_01355 [FCB group bacterium]|nr:hypothetical protein [FCB group bacterium]